jgi:glycosyltransferase involved in cell wall biosynthesis
MSSMLRVVFGVDNLNVGGTELNALRTATRLHGRYAEVTVFALQDGGPLAAEYRAAGIVVRTSPIIRFIEPSTMRQQAQLYSFLRAQRPHVFHSHDKYSNIFGLAVARTAGIPAVIGSRRWNRSDDGRGLAVANRAAYTFAHRVLFNSTRLSELVGRRELIPRRKRSVVPNFLERGAFERPSEDTVSAWRRELGLKPGVPVIGCVANLRPIKDHVTLLQAVALLAGSGVPLQVVLVGAGDQAVLSAHARELGLADKVYFAGARPSRPSFHHLFDISTLVSVSEGFSNSVLEAMAAARPVVATNVGGIADAVRHGETGLLVPPRSPQVLAGALLQLLERPDMCARMGERARAVASTDFGEEGVITQLLHLYQALLPGGRNGRPKHA